MAMYAGSLVGQAITPKRSVDVRKSVIYRSNFANGVNDSFILNALQGSDSENKITAKLTARHKTIYIAFTLSFLITISATFLFQQRERLSIENDSGKLLQSLKQALSEQTQQQEGQITEVFMPDPEPAKAQSVISYKVKESEGVDSILSRIGINNEEKLKAVSALSFLGNLKLGASLEVLKQETGGLLSLRFHRQDNSTVSLNKTELGGFQTVVKQADGAQKSQRVYSAMITGSFGEAVKRAGVPSYVIDDFVDLFDDKVNFQKDLSRGDSFAVMLEELDQSSKNKEPKILAATIKADGKPYYAIRYIGSDSKVRYVDEKGNGGDKSFLKYPLQFTRISSVFSNARFHPMLKRSRPHNGVDFAAPYGTVVRTIGDGMILEARYHPENGNFVRIKHNDRYTTEYLHLAKIGAGVRQGARVTQGQIIGQVGSTGLSTGTHLHFGLFDTGHYINPMNSQVLTAIATNKKDVVPAKYLASAIVMLKEAQIGAIDLRVKQLALVKTNVERRLVLSSPNGAQLGVVAQERKS